MLIMPIDNILFPLAAAAAAETSSESENSEDETTSNEDDEDLDLMLNALISRHRHKKDLASKGPSKQVKRSPARRASKQPTQKLAQQKQNPSTPQPTGANLQHFRLDCTDYLPTTDRPSRVLPILCAAFLEGSASASPSEMATDACNKDSSTDATQAAIADEGGAR